MYKSPLPSPSKIIYILLFKEVSEVRDPQGLNIVRRGGMGFLFKSQFLVFRAKQPVVQFVKIREININISQNTIYWA